jgi:hypothetical protein
LSGTTVLTEKWPVLGRHAQVADGAVPACKVRR